MIYFNQISDLKLVDPKNKEVVPIKLFVENCLTKTGKNALVKIGRQGGYYKVPDESITVLNERTPLYYSNLKSNLPSKKRIENELSWYLKDNLHFCMDNITIFNKQGYKLDFGNKIIDFSDVVNKDNKTLDWSVKTQIFDSEVLFSLNFPITIRKGNQVTRVSKFQNKLPIRLGKVYSTAQQMLIEYSKKPDYICLSCFDDLKDKDIKVNTLPQRDILWYLITDDKSIVSGQNYFFKFAVEFLVDEPQTQKIILPIGKLNAFAGKAFQYHVKTTSNDLVFYDDSEFFEIDKLKGIISFTPTKEQVGENIFEISVTDKKGNQDSELILLNIKSSSTDPILDYVGVQQAFLGEPFLYDVNVTNMGEKEINYWDNTELFNISENGLINFTPLVTGDYSIQIEARTKEGGLDKTEMELVVTE